MIADLGSAVLEAFGSAEALPVTRYAASSHDAETGRWTAAETSVVSVQAAVQPMSPKDVALLAEGEETTEAIVIFTREPLVASDIQAQVQSDEVEWSGRRYKVLKVEDWTSQAGYAKAIAMRIGE